MKLERGSGRGVVEIRQSKCKWERDKKVGGCYAYKRQ